MHPDAFLLRRTAFPKEQLNIRAHFLSVCWGKKEEYPAGDPARFRFITEKAGLIPVFHIREFDTKDKKSEVRLKNCKESGKKVKRENLQTDCTAEIFRDILLNFIAGYFIVKKRGIDYAEY